MSTDTPSNAQGATSRPYDKNLAWAHYQALNYIFEAQKGGPLSVKSALDYYYLAQSLLSDSEFQTWLSLLGNRGTPENVMTRLFRIQNILKKYPILIQRFGIFLPSHLNFRLQTGTLPLPGFLEEKDKGNKSETAVNVDLNEFDKTSDSAEKTPDLLPKEDNNNPNYNFMEKLEQRFQNEPKVVSAFVSVMKYIKDNPNRNEISRDIFETQIFDKVRKLFDGHDDLIEDFKAFVPCANYQQAGQVSRSSFANDPSVASVYRYGSYEEHAFFVEVKKLLGYREVYDNFLRCLRLYNEDLVTRPQLIKMIIPFLGKRPDLLRKFKDILRWNESGENLEFIPLKIIKLENKRKQLGLDPDVDYSNGGRNGASYRALPHDFPQPKCSGRTSLDNEVLNDTWVSFPAWSEDSTFVTSCKTQYEETMYRCEDERFELDMAITANACTMQVMQDIYEKMVRMSNEERQVFHLDDSLNTGGSKVLHQKALHRLYGDKINELMEGLKRNPWVAVPLILKRLKAKDKEWRESQLKYIEIWRGKIDEVYLKSLDHQGINFRQNDSKTFRPKSLEKEMEDIYIEKRHNPRDTTPHFTMEFIEMEVFEDAIILMLQYLKKLPGVYRDDRRKIERVIRSLIPDIFGSPRFTSNESEDNLEIEELSRDPPEEPMELIRNEEEERSGPTSPAGSNRDDGSSDVEESNSNAADDLKKRYKSFVEEIDVFGKIDPLPLTHLPYTLFYASKTWYIFFRQFHILFSRLSKLLLASKNGTVPERNIHSEDGSTSGHNNLPLYNQLLDKLGELLRGTVEYSQFEEESRKLFGIHAYVSYTMDKLIYSAVKQLHHIITDDISKECTAFFIQNLRAISNGVITSPMEALQLEHSYFKKVEKVIGDEKFCKIYWHKNEKTLTVELIHQESKNCILDPIEDEKWSNYIDNYLHGDSCELNDIVSESGQLPVILPRNLRRMQAYWKQKVLEIEKSWQVQQSAKFMKRNLMINRKRRAMARFSHSIRKIPRRSMVQEKNVNLTISKSESIVDMEHPVEDIAETKEHIPESIMQRVNVTTLEKPAAEPEKEENPELRVFITTKEESEEPNLILVKLSGDDDISMQEESVQETNAVDSKVDDVQPPAVEEPKKRKTTTEKESPRRESRQGENKRRCITETIDKDKSKENDATSDQEWEEKREEKSTTEEEYPRKVGLLKRRIQHKPFDCSVPTKRYRSKHTYLEKRVKKGITGTLQSSKGRRRNKSVKTKHAEILDDPSFDYADFSELLEDQKIHYLVWKYLDVKDDEEVYIEPGSYKMHFLQGCDSYMYRVNMLTKAKETHQSLSEIKSSNFNAWHRIWLSRNVTSSMFECYHEWMMKSDPDIYLLDRTLISDLKNPPYIPYYKYKIRYYKFDSL